MQDDCQCGPAENRVKCDCKPTNIGEIFSDISRQLPVLFPEGRFYQRPNSQIVASINQPVSAEFIITYEGTVSRTVQEVQQYRCSIENSILHGCYRCQKGARASITCKSDQPTLANIVCEQDTFSVPCSPKGETTNLHLQRNFARDQINCSAHCLTTTHFMLSGLLKYVEPFRNPFSATINESATYHELRGADLSHIFATFLSWYKTAVFLAVLLVIVLIATYLCLQRLLLVTLTFMLHISAIPIKLAIRVLRSLCGSSKSNAQTSKISTKNL